jgi:hypothetical protein
VSTFDSSEDLLDAFYRYLGTIDEHHSEFSASSAWDAIHVKGVEVERVDPDRVAEELGLDEVELEVEEAGFAIRRAGPGAHWVP